MSTTYAKTMNDQITVFKTQQLELYRRLFDELIDELTKLGFYVNNGTIPPPGVQGGVVNPLATKTPEFFNPAKISSMGVFILHKQDFIKLTFANNELIGVIKTWREVPERAKKYWIKYYPTRMRDGYYSLYQEKVSIVRAKNRLDSIINKSVKLLSEGERCRLARTAEMAEGRGQFVINSG